ncbi:MAG: hypothetical protein NW207_02620 [Cytophagales bacterium]|nr:hypothetical protein [Cytophagales bacterium]
MKYLVIWCIFWVNILSVWCQDKADDGEIETKEIIVEKNKKIEFGERQRIHEPIKYGKKDKTNSDSKTYTYDDPVQNFVPMEIKAKILAMKDENPALQRAGYIKAGLGTYITTYLEGAIYRKPNPRYDAGLYLKHFNSILGPTATALNSSSGTLKISGEGRYYYPKARLTGSAYYERHAMNYYGYHPSVTVDKANISQHYQLIGTQIGLQKADTLFHKNQYTFQSHIYHFTSAQGLSETQAQIGCNIQRSIIEDGSIYVSPDFTYLQYQNILPGTRSLFQMAATYNHSLAGYNLLLSGGFNIAIDSDTGAGNKSFNIYPVLEARYVFSQNYQLYAGISGGKEKNTFRSLANQNPFLGNEFSLYHTNSTIELYAGLRGYINNMLHFHIRPSYNRYGNMYFYQNSTTDSTKFTIYYNTNTTQVTKLMGEITFEPNQSLRLSARATPAQYADIAQYNVPLHRPTFEAGMNINYNLYNKLAFNVDVLYISGLKTISVYNNREVNLESIVDISIGANYKINERLGAFMYLNNILTRNYQRYYLYPMKGFEAIAGAIFNF